MKKLKNLFLAILSALLLFFSWYPNGFAGLIFVAWIPLLMISDNLIKQGKPNTVIKFFGYTFLTFLIWNECTTWWIRIAAGVGGVLAVVANALLMTFTMTLWHYCKIRQHHKVSAFVSLIAFWLTFEYIHLHWDLNWPWLNLGNVFANCPNWVQWYEYTGTFGGTLWILILNILGYQLYQKIRDKQSLLIKRYVIAILGFLIIPLSVSYIILKTYHESGDKIEIVATQQNTDPWHEQYEFSNQYHIHKILNLVRPYLSDSTKLLIAPESAIPNTILESDMQNKIESENVNYSFIDSLQNLTQQFPHLAICFGASTAEVFQQPTLTSRPYGREYIDMYNTAVSYGKSETFDFYHKARLVPAVEKMPFPKLLSPLEDLAIDLGGTTGSLGRGEYQKTFRTNDAAVYGAAICYESIFGEIFSAFVKNKAQLMCVITNDAWWGNTQGHKQHFEMSRLRAVETRRYVVRSANTGISGIIDPTGKVLQQTEYGKSAVVKADVLLLNKMTFYVKYGDYIARLCVCMSVMFLVYLLCYRIMIKLKRRKSLITF